MVPRRSELPYDLAVLLLGITSNIERRVQNRYLYTRVHSSIIVAAEGGGRVGTREDLEQTRG